jgi:hypothetical protein
VVEYPELGMEAIWRIEVEDFPAFIVIDDKGNDFFREVGARPGDTEVVELLPAVGDEDGAEQSAYAEQRQVAPRAVDDGPECHEPLPCVG